MQQARLRRRRASGSAAGGRGPGSYRPGIAGVCFRTAPTPVGNVTTFLHVRTAPTPVGNVTTFLHVRTAPTPVGNVTTCVHVRTAS